MKTPDPVLAAPLYPGLLTQFLQILTDLSPEDWQKPTPCPGWTIQDIGSHLLDGDIGNLSRKRDLNTASNIDVSSWEELVQRLNEKNELWVQAMRGTSPRILLDLLESFGNQVSVYYASLDPDVVGSSVAWAGPGAAPVWLDIARNYTERWHHQQQIRETLGIPLQVQPGISSPVIATFVHAMPQTVAKVTAPTNTTLRVSISGDAGGEWFVVRESDSWGVYVEVET